jgi:hypothetical protein
MPAPTVSIRKRGRKTLNASIAHATTETPTMIHNANLVTWSAVNPAPYTTPIVE